MDIPDKLPEGQYAIYALLDPTDGLVYYVGQTHRPQQRLLQHWGTRHYQYGEKAAWLRRLEEQGQQPLMQILEIVTGRNTALTQEQAWIRRFREQGMCILQMRMEPNTTPDTRTLIPPRPEVVIIAGCSILFIRLTDGRMASIHQSFCKALQLDCLGQLQRIYRNKLLAKHLLLVPILTNVGIQHMEVLVASAIPRWLEGLQVNRLAPAKRPLVRALQHEVEPALERHLSEKTAEPAALPPRVEQREPGGSASSSARRTAASQVLPSAHPLSPEHQVQLTMLARFQRSQTGEPIQAMNAELAAVFGVEDVSDIPDDNWDAVQQWFWQRGQQKSYHH